MPIERLSASNAAKHMACHASANLEVAIPGWHPPDVDDTAASSKGTSMHEVLELAATFSPAEMQALAEAMQYVAELRTKRRFNKMIEAEGNGWWLSSTPLTRADLVLWVSDEIHVIDYKFGRIPVDVFGNAQLKYYALAFAHLAPKAPGVTVHIVQPLAEHPLNGGPNIDSEFFSAAELEQFRLESVAAERAILAGDVTMTPGEHCKFCPANPHGRGVKQAPWCKAMLDVLYPSNLDVDDILR